MTTLLVRTHGRWDYLRQAMESLDPTPFDRFILSCDGCWPPFELAGWTVVSSAERRGLSANIAQAWSQLGNDEWVFDTEDDFVFNVQPPLDAMRAVLEATPNLAQMCLERQPLNPAERANGGLLGADNIPTFTAHDGYPCDAAGQVLQPWREQRHLFSYNPHLRKHLRGLFPKGWGGTELEATAHVRQSGWVFGMWGAQGDPPLVTHIGTEGGMGSAGWVA